MQTAILALLAAAGLVSASPAASSLSVRADIPSVTVKGNAFYANDKRFFLRGIDYQPGGNSKAVDPLADTSICKRDIKNFKDLGINTIRVYIVDNSKDHKECMQALADAGIYLVLDVNNSKYALNRAATDVHKTYNVDYIQNVLATVTEFAKYPNTLAFISGNEVVNDEKGTDKAAPYVKAITRDIKTFISNQKGMRKIPVGYAAADVSTNRMQIAQYLNCGADDARVDFFAFNDYSWCNSNFQESGWDQKVKNFTDYGLPIFLSEWGCIESPPRKFEELGALMSDEMTSVYSGGLLYEYTYEENHYGIVDVDGNDVKPRPEYKVFKAALAKYPAPSGDAGASSKGHSSTCPAQSPGWEVDPKVLPNIPSQAAKFITSGAGKGPGLDGPGSMDGGSQQSDTDGDANKPSTGGNSSDSKNAAVNAFGGIPAATATIGFLVAALNALAL